MKLDRCPICRGRLAEAMCKRCGADLGLVLAAAQLAEERQRAALRALRAGQIDAARLAARQAQALHRTPFATALVEFLIALRPRGSAGARTGRGRGTGRRGDH